MSSDFWGKARDAPKNRRSFKEKNGELDCAPLLELGEKQGIAKKTYCDSLVALAVSLVEELATKD